MEDRIGQQLGNYKILRRVGQGGFADVYLGEHIHLRTQAAIKVLQVRLGDNNIQNFLNEARTIAHLVHPYIVRVLDFGVQDNVPFLVMDYAPHGTFRQRFLQGKPLPPAPLVTYIKQTAAALQYGHDKKLIHRDVKPENMLLGPNDEVLLGDFGLALIAYNSISRSLTETAGTAAYMAPEQLQGKPRPASDQYALGVIAYEWLTGSCPFQGSFFEIASQQVLASPPAIREKVPMIPAEIEKVVLRALEKDPQQRFPQVRDFALALEEACLTGKQYSFDLPLNTLTTTQREAGAPEAIHSKVINASMAMNSLSAAKNAHPNNSVIGIRQLAEQSATAREGAQQFHPEQFSPRNTSTSALEQFPLSNSHVFRPQDVLLVPGAQSQINPVPFQKIAPQPDEAQLHDQRAQEQREQGSSTTVDINSLPALPIPEETDLWSSSALSKNGMFDFSALSTPASAAQPGNARPNMPAFTTPQTAPARKPEDRIILHQIPASSASGKPKNLMRAATAGIVILIMIVIITSGISIFTVANNSAAQQQAKQAANATATSQANTHATMTTIENKNLQATQTAQEKIARINPYFKTGGGTLLQNDTLTSNQHNWPEGTDISGSTTGTCIFSPQGYQIIAPSLLPTACIQTQQMLTNFTYQVNLSFASVGQSYSGGGLIFRANNASKAYYFFELFGSGNYSIQKCVSSNCADYLDGYKLGKSAIPNFKTGINTTNTLAVTANGDTFTFFVNKVQVTQITDETYTYTSGTIGLLATAGNDTGLDTAANTQTTAIFTNAKVWQQ
ncbi:serine/threonine protein kinase [Dictyobacter arantiisoli]|uniref:Protein kinase domain-containing protein n=1 Tax=Dictyobacter arantiisoli TaxID=2014874 RepID=A0A5A5T751_9CHLR|nr:serine/threonine-protein kinase [Dictyobacter arantiisoli]GCF06764.1 hypothetical protein KDI_03280 [Dictyobacter arantiisoli]